jgi:hypothetical protein
MFIAVGRQFGFGANSADLPAASGSGPRCATGAGYEVSFARG